MTIGTGKDYEDYVVNGKTIPYHLIDIVDAGTHYHVHRFQQDFATAYRHICNLGKQAILCGGTGLYIQSVLNQFEYTSIPINPALRNQLSALSKEELTAYFNQLPKHSYHPFADLSTSKRIIRAIEISLWLQNNTLKQPTHVTPDSFIIGLKPTLENRRAKIAERLKKRLSNGLIEEVKQLLANGLSTDQIEYYGLEYKFVSLYLRKELTYAELEEKLTTAICQFAKRQMTYFRKMEKDGHTIHWFDASLPHEHLIEQVTQQLNNS